MVWVNVEALNVTPELIVRLPPEVVAPEAVFVPPVANVRLLYVAATIF